MPQGRLTTPRAPLLDANGNLDVSWQAFLQALADRLADIDALLPPPPAAP